MLSKRIIPCLDVKEGRVVKGIKFSGLRDMGDPVERALHYQNQGADELVFLDVSATPEGRRTHVQTIRNIRERLNIPFTTGGGVRAVEDAGRLLDAGADKISVNTAAVLRPELIDELAKNYGSQCTVLALDAKCSGADWTVVIRSGASGTIRRAVEWAREGESRGAGEILLTSIDRDGTRDGYDCELLRQVCQAVGIPVIASGGANEPEHLLEAFEAGADAALAASIFHEAEYTVEAVKQYLQARNIQVRL